MGYTNKRRQSKGDCAGVSSVKNPQTILRKNNSNTRYGSILPVGKGDTHQTFDTYQLSDYVNSYRRAHKSLATCTQEIMDLVTGPHYELLPGMENLVRSHIVLLWENRLSPYRPA